DSEKTQVVTDGTSSAIYASGHLLFLRESTLLAAPFDPARLVIIGEAVPVADHVLMVTGEPRGVFTAADNGTLVYQTADSDTALSLAWFDRSGRRLSTVAEVGDARNLILSPNGGFSIVPIDGPQRRTDLWRIDLGNGLKSRLTSNGTVANFAVFSPDGSEIVYAGRREGRPGVFRKPSTGVDDGALLYSGNVGVRAWSRDGHYLLLDGGGVSVLLLAPENSGSQHTPFPFASDHVAPLGQKPQGPALSPDGRWVAYFLGGKGTFVDAFPRGGKRQQVSEGGTLPRWRPDGKELNYLASSASGGMLTAVDVSEVGGSLQFGARRGILGPLIGGRGYPYDVSADGQRFLVLVTSGRRAAQPLTLVQNWVAALKAR